jgi:hypothetical protein
MQGATETHALSPAGHAENGMGWQVLWFLLHLAAVYAITMFCTTRLAVWTRGTVLPLLQEPTSSSGSEFLFSHIFAFSFAPAFAVGLINARFKHKVAQLVWLVPTVILAYKFLTFPAPSVFYSQFSVAFHQYFESGFQVPEFRDWHDFWTAVRSYPDMMRGVAQLNYTAPAYAGIGYSLAAWIGRQANLGEKVSEKVKNWEDSRFGPRSLGGDQFAVDDLSG